MSMLTQTETKELDKINSVITFNDMPELRSGARKDLLDAINYISKHVEDDWNGHPAIKPTLSTLQMAECFMNKMPSSKKQADRIEPDGDGGILLEWKEHNDRILLTIDGIALHLSCRMGSQTPIFVEDKRFFDKKDAIPQEILTYIPKKPSNA